MNIGRKYEIKEATIPATFYNKEGVEVEKGLYKSEADIHLRALALGWSFTIWSD